MADRLGPDYRPFGQWCRDHAAEETDHEKWLLDDLSTVGVDRRALSRRSPSAEIAQLIGTQFLLATSDEPAALLGYFYLGECHPADPSALEEQREELGFPASAMRTLMFHAQEDKDHQVEIRELVKVHGVGIGVLQAMATSGIAYADAWTRVYRRLCGQLSERSAVASGGAR